MSIGEHVNIHRECQKKAYNVLKRKSVELEQPVKEAKKTRSSLYVFKFKENCLFCGNVAKKNPKNPSRNRIGYVRTLPFRNCVLNICNERKDDWAEEVRMRTMSCSDLVTAEALYQRFSISLEKEPMQEPSSGRPFVKDFDEKFNLLCEWLESEAELYA